MATSLPFERFRDSEPRAPTRRSHLVSGLFGAALAAGCFSLFLAGQRIAPAPQGSAGAVLLEAAATTGRRASEEVDVVVELPEGQVRGRQSKMYGRKFQGIPYGKAGRFANPEPVLSYVGEWDAQSFRASCLRGTSHNNNEHMSEDCLHLNIYTPILEEHEAALPVLVWFHGGSFTMGAGSDTSAEDVKELVLSQGMIVVTINYRLGVFGFLGSERLRRGENASVGNFGTLDQQLALRLIQKRISFFGGDPTRVGLVGWSAGAASISNHLVMPSSRGLFSSAIMMSGGFASWAAQSMQDAEHDYDGMLRLTGCDKSDACLERGPPCRCLLDLTSDQLLDAQAKLGAAWAPTVDGTHLPRHPADAVQEGAVNPGVPVIIGGTREDCLADIGAAATAEDFVAFAALPIDQGGLGLSMDDARKARRLYIDGASPPRENGLDRWSPAYWAARRAGADRSMSCVARRAARRWQEVSGAPAFWYVWENNPSARYPDPTVGPPGQPLKIGGCWPCPGATHGSDLPFLFEKERAYADDAKVDLAAAYQAMFRNLIFNSDPNKWKGLIFASYGNTSGSLASAWPQAPAAGMVFEAGKIRSVADLRSVECDMFDAAQK